MKGTKMLPEQERNKATQKKSSKRISRKSIKTRIPHSLSSPGGGSSDASIPARQGWHLPQGSASGTMSPNFWHETPDRRGGKKITYSALNRNFLL